VLAASIADAARRRRALGWALAAALAAVLATHLWRFGLLPGNGAVAGVNGAVAAVSFAIAWRSGRRRSRHSHARAKRHDVRRNFPPRATGVAQEPLHTEKIGEQP
jgi:membrane associated rhomboid family serine protease